MIYQLQQFRLAYTTHRWVRTATSATLFVYVIALYWLTGGFPPWAWRMLFQVVPTLPRLWAIRGVTVVLPFVVLVLYSLSLLILWGALLFSLAQLVLHWWWQRQKRQDWESRTRSAERMATQQMWRGATIPAGSQTQGRASLAPPFAKETMAALQLRNTGCLRVGTASDAGRVRGHLPNEDSVLAVQETRITDAEQLPVGLFVVADGMGGHADGQQASQLVIQVLSEMVLPVLRDNGADERMCAHMLYLGVQRANFTLYQRNQQRHAMMGTTMTGVLIFGTRAHIVSVGDSRTYLYRPSKGLAQVTRDHSIVAELVAAKVIAPEAIYTHPKRNEVTRCLGKEAEVEIDTFTVSLQSGDVLLPCSDGLWEMVHDPEIEELVAPFPRDAQHLSELLIQAALNRGGKDNVSVIVVELVSAA